MNRFITHEALASNLLNAGHCSGQGITLPWQSFLTNTEKSLELVIQRMESDWCALAPKMRKSWTSSSLDPHLNLIYFLSRIPSFFCGREVSQQDTSETLI